jgi:beta-phosphoglucomutase family hydrolase
MKAIRLLVAQADAVTTNSGRADEGARRAVARLRRAGVLFAMTTRRPPRAIESLAQDLGVATPVAALGGALFFDAKRRELVEERTLPLAVATEALEIIRTFGLEPWVYRGFDWFVARADTTQVAVERTRAAFDPVVLDDLPSVLEGAVKLVGVGDGAARVAECEAELQRRLGLHVVAARTTAYAIDVTHPDANGATVVRTFARLLRVPANEIAAIGRTPEDVLLFGAAGTGIAMGDASVEVKRAARHVTSSSEQDGFAHAVERFVLHEPRHAPESLGLPPGTRACLFDLDGVLTQTAKIHATAWKRTFDALLRDRAQARGEEFVPFDPAADYARYVDGKLRRDGARSFLAARGLALGDAELEALVRRKDALFLAIVREEHVETYDGSVRFVREARDAGLKTAVVSASRNCREVLESGGIEELFDVRIDGVVAAEEHLAGKPAPDTFLAAARAVGVDPLHSAVFEDALSGVEAGRAGHFGLVVGVDRLGQADELMRHGANVVVTDLNALLGAP